MVSTRETDPAHFKPVPISPLEQRYLKLEEALEDVELHVAYALEENTDADREDILKMIGDTVRKVLYPTHSCEDNAGPVVGRKGDQGAKHEGPSASNEEKKP